jgi:hypothetical protein
MYMKGQDVPMENRIDERESAAREGHMHVGTGSGCLPTDTVTETGLRVVFASRNNETRQGTVLSGSREESNKCIYRRQSCLC